MSRRTRRYEHTARVLIGAEANRMMQRILKLTRYLDSVTNETQFNVVAKHLATVEHDFAMMGYMTREDPREVLVRVHEYRNLNKKMSAR